MSSYYEDSMNYADAYLRNKADRAEALERLIAREIKLMNDEKTNETNQKHQSGHPQGEPGH